MSQRLHNQFKIWTHSTFLLTIDIAEYIKTTHKHRELCSKQQ